MSEYRLTSTARNSIDEIYDYTAIRWGEEQASTYTHELFDELGRIAVRHVPWRTVPKRFGFAAHCRHWRKHMIYWFEENGELYFFAVLHERMAQAGRAQSAFSEAKKR